MESKIKEMAVFYIYNHATLFLSVTLTLHLQKDIFHGLRCSLYQIIMPAEQFKAALRVFFTTFFDWVSFFSLVLFLASKVRQGAQLAGKDRNGFQLFGLNNVESQIILVAVVAVTMQINDGIERVLQISIGQAIGTLNIRLAMRLYCEFLCLMITSTVLLIVCFLFHGGQ